MDQFLFYIQCNGNLNLPSLFFPMSPLNVHRKYLEYYKKYYNTNQYLYHS